MLVPAQSVRSLQQTTTTDPLTRLTANSGYAIVAPYDSVATGVANFGGVAGNTSREYLVVGRLYRIRQTGTIQQVKLYTYNLTNLTAIYIKVWRLNGTTYDLVGTSNNILSSCTSATSNTIVLSSPIIGVQEGDFYGYRFEWSSGAQNVYSKSGVALVTTYSVVNTTPSTTGYAWASQTANAGYVVPIELYMTPPIFVSCGDSILSGHPDHASYIDSAYTYDSPHKQVSYHIGLAFNYSYQNMAIGGESVTTRLARFNSDVVALKPKFALLQGGTADLFSTTTRTQYISYWSGILDLCIANSIIPVCILMPPCTDTRLNHTTRELWNRDLVNIIHNTYPTAIIVDTETYIGLNYAAGDAGNLWYILAAATTDNIHPNANGKRGIAKAIVEACLRYKVTP
jgi:hypothetical protein